jgi:hypothetical protein|tara:strand:+ start:287 stop:1030 length:744 start_codon:yes stop_codon:yes gene_type:complete
MDSSEVAQSKNEFNKKVKEGGVSNGSIGGIYMILIILLAFIRYRMTRIKNYSKDMLLPKKNFRPYVLVPILIVLFTAAQGFINSSVLKGRCGNPMYIEAFSTAFVTMIFIFGMIGSLIEAFPSWKRPFYNTFGTLFVRLKKTTKQEIATKIFIPSLKKKDTHLSEKIKKDINIILKEINPYNFQLFMNNLDVPVNETTSQLLKKLYNLFLKKDIISTTFWYILTIILVVTINMNTIIGMPCDKPITV